MLYHKSGVSVLIFRDATPCTVLHFCLRFRFHCALSLRVKRTAFLVPGVTSKICEELARIFFVQYCAQETDTMTVFKACYLIYKMDIIKLQTYGIVLEANVND